MYSPSVRIEKHSNTISDVVGLFGIDYDQCFGYIEEMSAYIEGLLLGISSIYPFVRGVVGYEKNGDQVKVIEKTIVGAEKINAIGRYMRNEFSLSDCKFIPELSQKAFCELPKRLQSRLESVLVLWYSVEWTGKDTDYGDIASKIRKSFFLDLGK